MKSEESFIKIIQNHIGIIHKAATIYTNSPQDKEDLTQEIIYQLWKSYPSFNYKSSISTWLYRVSMNVSIYFLSQSQRKPATLPIDKEILEIKSSSNLEHQENWRKIYFQINKLNTIEKGIILLYLERKSYKDIAEILGLSESNIGTKMQRIKAKLKKEIRNK